MSTISVVETVTPLNREPWTTTFIFPDAPGTGTLTATFTRDNGEVYTTEIIYPPLRLERVSPNVPSLTSQWQTLTFNMLIPTWTPGMSTKKGEFDNRGTFTPYRRSSDKDGDGWMKRDEAAEDGQLQGTIMRIVLPIVFVGGLLLVTCWAGCRKARKQRKREAQERAAAEDGGETGVAMETRREGPLARGIREAKEEAREMTTGVAKVAGGAPV